jgi:DNA-binding response OmpR family regulator
MPQRNHETAKERILVVDDELDMRTFLCTLLQAGGYVPIVAENSSQGLKKAKDSRPGLIILNVMMPGESGIYMYRKLKTSEELRHIPVIMLSGVAKKTFFSSQYLLDYCGRSLPEPEAYMEKPPESEELLQATQTLLSRTKPTV